MKWFKRKPREILVNIGGTDPINGLAFPMTVTHSKVEVMHKVQKMPDPVPVRGWMIIQNEEGQIWQTNPFMINGRSGMRIYVNKSWLTGKQSDLQYQIGMELHLEYQERV